jgi:hypothetical protein
MKPLSAANGAIFDEAQRLAVREPPIAVAVSDGRCHDRGDLIAGFPNEARRRNLRVLENGVPRLFQAFNTDLREEQSVENMKMGSPEKSACAHAQAN